MTFNELVDNLGVSNYNVYVNGVRRDTHYTDSDRLYSTNCNLGDVISIEIIDQGDTLPIIGVKRRDYTTDSEDGNNGIYDNDVNYDVVTQTGTIYTIQFTASTVNTAYDFEYRIDVSEIFNPDCELEGFFGGLPIPVPPGPTAPVTLNFRYVLNADPVFNTNNSITYTVTNLSGRIYSNSTGLCPASPYNYVTLPNVTQTGTGSTIVSNTIIIPYEELCSDKLYFYLTRRIAGSDVGIDVKRSFTTIAVNQSYYERRLYGGTLTGGFLDEALYVPELYLNPNNRFTVLPGDSLTITWIDTITNS